MSRTFLTLVIAVALTACKRPVESPTGDEEVPTARTTPTTGSAHAAKFPSNDTACDDATQSELQTWFDGYAAWSVGVDWDGVGPLAPRYEPAPAFGTPASVYVDADGVRAQEAPGKRAERLPVSEVGEVIEERIRLKQRELELLGRPNNTPGLLLAFGPDTPWASVVEVVNTAGERGHSTIELAFERLRPPQFEVPKHLRRVFEQAIVDREMPRRDFTVAETCESFQPAWEAVMIAIDDRAQQAADKIPDAWRRCDCRPDIEWVAGRVAFTTEQPVVRVALRLDPAAPVVVLPANTPWSDAATQLIDVDAARLSVGSD